MFFFFFCHDDGSCWQSWRMQDVPSLLSPLVHVSASMFLSLIPCVVSALFVLSSQDPSLQARKETTSGYIIWQLGTVPWVFQYLKTQAPGISSYCVARWPHHFSMASSGQESPQSVSWQKGLGLWNETVTFQWGSYCLVSKEFWTPCTGIHDLHDLRQH